MRLIDADALIEKWYEVNDIGPEDRGARFIGYSEIPRFINNAPTVETTGDYISRAEWIPVSDRMPEDGQGVIVTVDDNDYEIKVGSCIYSNGRFHSLYNDLTVLAWMPLPKPYREESEV